MTNENKNVGWKLWLQWVLVYSFSFAVASKYYQETFYDITAENWLFSIFVLISAVLIYGFILGGAQWLVLRQYNISPWWIVATILGLPFIFLPGSAILQSFILYRHVHRAGFWTLAQIPTFILIIGFEWYSDALYPILSGLDYDEQVLLISIIAGIIGAVITATTLVWLFQNPKLPAPER